MRFMRPRWLIVAGALVAAFASPGVARGDAVTDWNSYANAAIFATTPTAHAAVLKTAMVQAAVYDAVNAIAGGYRPYLPTAAADPMYSQDAAAATAAFRVAARDSRRGECGDECSGNDQPAGSHVTHGSAPSNG